MKTLKKGKAAPAASKEIEDKDAEPLELAASSKAVTSADAPAEVPVKSAKKRSSKAKAAGRVQTTETEAPSAGKKSRNATATSPVKKAKKSASIAKRSVALETSAALQEPGEVEVVVPDPLASMSPVDRLLAQPVLPPRDRENRARLQMQSPTKLHFYWSVRENPWATLRKAFSGDTGSYTLVLKLVELRSGAEEVHNADADGDWWFNVRPDGEYQAEIGFYAPNRPYIRIVYSNVIETPRLKPSPRKAAESDWAVSAQRFARVLDVAGFARDAFDVAVAGDDPTASASAARQALQQFADGRSDKLAVIDDEDIRYAMLAFAEGQKLDDLRWTIQPELFDYLQASGGSLNAENAEAALREHFDLDDIEFDSEETGPAVFGASLVNFPRRARSTRRPRLEAPSPEGSHNLGRGPRPQ